MDVLSRSLELIGGHWKLGALQCLVFILGLASAGLVLRYRLAFLMRFPLWIMGRILRFLARRPGFVPIFLLIFLFNSMAIFIYMMTGALLSVLPTAVCFLTGMNIGIVAGAMPRVAATQISERSGPSATEDLAPPLAGQDARSPAGSARGGATEVICFLLVAGLELPVFWLSLAMGTTMSPFWPGAPAPAGAGPIALRVTAYLAIGVPTLCLSALIETVGIRLGLRHGRPPTGLGAEDADGPHGAASA